MNRSDSGKNSPSVWSSLKLSGWQSAFRRSGNPLDNTYYISDIQRCILWAISQSQVGEWVLVTISPLIFLNGYILPTRRRHIDLPTKSITFDTGSSTMTGVPVLPIWRRQYHILHSKAGTKLTRQRFSTYYPLPISGEVHAEPIFYVSKQMRMSPLSALYHSSYIIWETRMSVECAEVLN